MHRPYCSLVLEAMPQLSLSLSPKNETRRSLILSVHPIDLDYEDAILPPKVADAIQMLWDDPSVKEAVQRSHEYQLNDCAAYYLDSVERFLSPGYLPTEKDILQSYVKTTGITETIFEIGELRYRVFDTGGQRSERKKWIHCFENVTAVVFVVSLNEYNLSLYEDESVVWLLSPTVSTDQPLL